MNCERKDKGFHIDVAVIDVKEINDIGGFENFSFQELFLKPAAYNWFNSEALILSTECQKLLQPVKISSQRTAIQNLRITLQAYFPFILHSSF